MQGGTLSWSGQVDFASCHSAMRRALVRAALPCRLQCAELSLNSSSTVPGTLSFSLFACIERLMQHHGPSSACFTAFDPLGESYMSRHPESKPTCWRCARRRGFQKIVYPFQNKNATFPMRLTRANGRLISMTLHTQIVPTGGACFITA